jgi:hypothetical protein
MRHRSAKRGEPEALRLIQSMAVIETNPEHVTNGRDRLFAIDS